MLYSRKVFFFFKSYTLLYIYIYEFFDGYLLYRICLRSKSSSAGFPFFYFHFCVLSKYMRIKLPSTKINQSWLSLGYIVIEFDTVIRSRCYMRKSTRQYYILSACCQFQSSTVNNRLHFCTTSLSNLLLCYFTQNFSFGFRISNVFPSKIQLYTFGNIGRVDNETIIIEKLRN